VWLKSNKKVLSIYLNKHELKNLQPGEVQKKV